MSAGADHVVVLAAGRGTRAGGPKALHRMGDELWWESQQKRLSRVWLPVTWVVSERVLARIRESGRGGGGEPSRFTLADESAPMFASIRAGLEAIDRESRGHSAPTAIFVLPVDVPAPDRKVFTQLAKALRSNHEAAAAVPVHTGQHGHPVCVSWSFLSERVLNVAPSSDARLDRMIGPARVEVDVADPGVLVNLNTAAEFASWAMTHSASAG